MSDPFSVEQSGDCYRVSGVLDFTTARQALNMLAPLVKTCEHLHIDLSQLNRCNSAALAVLIELKALARRQGHQVSFTQVPSGIEQLARVCQVDGYI